MCDNIKTESETDFKSELAIYFGPSIKKQTQDCEQKKGNEYSKIVQPKGISKQVSPQKS